MTREQLGRRIAGLRCEKFGSIRNAAKSLGVSYETLRSIEHGQIKRVDVFWLAHLSLIFGVDLLAEVKEGEES